MHIWNKNSYFPPWYSHLNKILQNLKPIDNFDTNFYNLRFWQLCLHQSLQVNLMCSPETKISMFQGPDEKEAWESCSCGSDIQMAFPHQVDQRNVNYIVMRECCFNFWFCLPKNWPTLKFTISVEINKELPLEKSKGDQNFWLKLNPEEKVVKLFQGSSLLHCFYIWSLCFNLQLFFIS